jgi:hypothetical protein
MYRIEHKPHPVLRGRMAVAGRDNFLDPGPYGKCFDKSTARATVPACDYDVHQSLPAPLGAGQSLLQHFPPLGRSASLQMGSLSQCQTFY